MSELKCFDTIYCSDESPDSGVIWVMDASESAMKKFRVYSTWLKPSIEAEDVEASNAEEARAIVQAKYENAQTDSGKTWQGVHDVEEI